MNLSLIHYIPSILTVTVHIGNIKKSISNKNRNIVARE